MSGVTVDGAEVRVALVTCPDDDTAERIATALLVEQLVACANLVAGVRSIYRWRGEIERAEECLVVLKTRSACVDRLATRIGELHPYDVPEFIVLPVDRGLPDYLSWVVEETQGQS